MSDLFLAIDTATDHGTAALGGERDDLIEVPLSAEPRRHASRLLPTVLALLETSGRSLGDVTDLVIGDGPGSFTGLRVAAAFAKGLLTETGIVFHAVPSMMGCARQGELAGAPVPIAVLYDALRGEVFVGVFEAHTTLISPRLVAVSEIQTLGPVRAAGGDGARRYPQEVKAWTGEDPLPSDRVRASAGALIRCVQEERRRFVVVDAAGWEPLYGRQAAAQAKWEARHGRSLPYS